MSTFSDKFSGIVGMLFFAGPPLAFLLSVILIRLYRRRVIGLMDAASGVATNPPSTPAPPSRPVEAAESITPERVLAAMKTRASRATLALAVGIVAFALWSAGVVLAASSNHFSPVLFLELFSACVWPFVPVLAVATSAPRRRVLVMAAGYLLVLAICGVVSAAHYEKGAAAGFAAPFQVWLVFEALPTMAILAMLHRRIRGISAMVFAAVALWVLGSTLTMALLANHSGIPSRIAWRLGLGANSVIAGTLFCGIALGTVALAPLLAALRRAYLRKRVSEYNLVIHPLPAVFALFQAGILVFSGTRWVPLALAGLVVYGAAYAIAARRPVRRAAPSTRPLRLLYLRVFGDAIAQERLFRAWAGRWRHVGTIRLLTGPDLATAVVEPPAFLDFVTGRLDRRFIDSEATLDRALATEDLLVDPDGRYRVTNLFCHQNTWRVTFSRLAQDSDVALMDLRGFAPEREGTSYELRHLASSMPVERIVLIIDGTTDLDRVTELVRSGVNRLPRMIRFDEAARNDTSDLMRAVCEAACTPAPALVAAASA